MIFVISSIFVKESYRLNTKLHTLTKNAADNARVHINTHQGGLHTRSMHTMHAYDAMGLASCYSALPVLIPVEIDVKSR